MHEWKKKSKKLSQVVSSMSQPYTQTQQKYFQNFHMFLCRKRNRSSRGVFSADINSTSDVI